MDDNMKSELCVRTLKDACRKYSETRLAIVHSDRGSQYTSEKYRATIAKFEVRQSMNSVGGRCHDNDMISNAENFISALSKVNILHTIKTKNDGKQVVFFANRDKEKVSNIFYDNSRNKYVKKHHSRQITVHILAFAIANIQRGQGETSPCALIQTLKSLYKCALRDIWAALYTT